MGSTAPSPCLRHHLESAGLGNDAVRADTAKTRLVNVACSGETVVTLVRGGRCSYEEGTQLAQALEFLHAHRRTTRPVTIDIGANDVQRCVGRAPLAIDFACIQAVAQQSVALQAALNTVIAQSAASVGADVADVSTAFHSTVTAPVLVPELGGVVRTNVATICAWTWMCRLGDIHANDAGYAVMSGAVAARL
ncbi:MAG: SGNH/GDSL hydrolase family protein [Ornithinibacter sp.]